MEFFTGTGSVNAWVLFNKVTDKKTKILQLQENIVSSLIHKEDPQQPAATFDSVHVISRAHFLEEVPGHKKATTSFARNQRAKKARVSALEESTYCGVCEGRPFFEFPTSV